MVVEAREGEDADLEADHDENRLADEIAVAIGDCEVEAEGEGQVPGDRDETCVHEQVEDAAAVEPPHDAALRVSAERTPSTTRSCCSAVIAGHKGSASVSRAARSVSGRPLPELNELSAGWRWSGVE